MSLDYRDLKILQVRKKEFCYRQLEIKGLYSKQVDFHYSRFRYSGVQMCKKYGEKRAIRSAIFSNGKKLFVKKKQSVAHSLFDGCVQFPNSLLALYVPFRIFCHFQPLHLAFPMKNDLFLFVHIHSCLYKGPCHKRRRLRMYKK